MFNSLIVSLNDILILGIFHILIIIENVMGQVFRSFKEQVLP